MWMPILPSSELPANGMRPVLKDGVKLLLVRTAKGLFALENKCPHQEQTLEGGELHPDAIECPWHSVTIQLSDGKILNDMGWYDLPPVRVFPVREEGGQILVDLPPGLSEGR
jgi:nitrite reductase/ring-hydroxylating ferredoxin subunit